MKLFFTITLFCVNINGWDLLSKVSLSRVYDEMMGQEVDQPVFLGELVAKEGSQITLTGYVILLEAGSDQDYFVLSRFPFQSCFFCGAAGPETVAEIYPSDSKTSLIPDQRVQVTGTLELNQSDPMHLFYILKSAEVTEL